jgi:DNA end-binding protein Ku
MADSGLVGIAKYVMRNQQHLGCLRVREGVLALEKMYFADEIRQPGDIKPKRVSVGKQELQMAAELIDRFAGSFDIEKYEDTYRKALLKVIRAKAKGKEVHVERQPQPEEAPDLMAALRASVEAANGGRKAARKSNGGRKRRKKAAARS